MKRRLGARSLGVVVVAAVCIYEAIIVRRSSDFVTNRCASPHRVASHMCVLQRQRQRQQRVTPRCMFLCTHNNRTEQPHSYRIGPSFFSQPYYLTHSFSLSSALSPSLSVFSTPPEPTHHTHTHTFLLHLISPYRFPPALLPSFLRFFVIHLIHRHGTDRQSQRPCRSLRTSARRRRPSPPSPR